MSRTMVAVEAPVTTRRQDRRQRVSIDATVTVLGVDEQVLQGTMHKAGEGNAQLTLDGQVPTSSLVKIEYADSFLLGEVVHCQAEGSNWRVVVRVEHALFGLTALAAALRKSWG